MPNTRKNNLETLFSTERFIFQIFQNAWYFLEMAKLFKKMPKILLRCTETIHLMKSHLPAISQYMSPGLPKGLL